MSNPSEKDHSFPVTRDGVPLGEFRSDQISARLDSGLLVPTDHFYDAARKAWRPLSELETHGRVAAGSGVGSEPPAPSTPASTSGDAPQVSASEEEGRTWEERERRGRRRRRSSSSGDPSKKKRHRNPAERALPGWIACLFAIGVAAGLWAWAQSLRDSLKVQEAKVTELTSQVTALNQQISVLQEMAPPGIVRGIITTEPTPGKLAILSGVTVGILRAADVRTALLRMANSPTANSEGEFGARVTELQSNLPSAEAITLTDSGGRFELAVSDPGNYAIVATAFKQSPGGPERLLWLIEVTNADEPSPVISLSEKNAVSLRNPMMRLLPPHGAKP